MPLQTVVVDGKSYTIDLPELNIPFANIDWSKADWGQFSPNAYNYMSYNWNQVLTPEWYDKNYLPTYESIKQEIDLIRQGVFLVDGRVATDADLIRLYDEKLKVIERAVPKYKARMEEIASKQPGMTPEKLIATVSATAAVAPPPFGLVALGVSTLFGIASGIQNKEEQKKTIGQLQFMQLNMQKITSLNTELVNERKALIWQQYAILALKALGIGLLFAVIAKLIKTAGN